VTNVTPLFLWVEIDDGIGIFFDDSVDYALGVDKHQPIFRVAHKFFIGAPV
jgi:hypothetical protein